MISRNIFKIMAWILYMSFAIMMFTSFGAGYVIMGLFFVIPTAITALTILREKACHI